MADGTAARWSRRRIAVALVVAGAAATAAAVAIFIPAGVDWRTAFRPGALDLLRTGNPFDTPGYFNAPWAAVLLLPLALLPEQVGYGLLVVIGLAASAYAAHRLGASPLTLALFLLSPPVLHSLLNGNIDWMPLLGYVLPPQIGLLLVTIKPQMGSVVAVFWLIETWRAGGWREVLRVFWPVTALMGLSLALYGLWPLRFEAELDLWWNASLWPASIPVGLVLAVSAVRRREIRFAMAASPCLAPYVLLHSWSAALIGLVGSKWEMVAAFAGLWLLIILQAVG
jgi:hypothetical protein